MKRTLRFFVVLMLLLSAMFMAQSALTGSCIPVYTGQLPENPCAS